MDTGELQTLWEAHGVDADTLSIATDGTIASDTDAGRPAARIPTARLPALEGEADQPPQLSLGKTLGEGGMGVVRRGRQLVLDRDVAVKSLRSGEKVDALLGEARVTGGLEHPNIVPIYTLGRGADQTPLIVMKQIEGTSWADALADPDFVPPDGQGRLLYHVDVLMHVCRAVHFAHSRGVLHRDIKPDNVMIGSFGEVYLLDWGVAVGIGERRIEGLPIAAETKGVVGTPGYMAPEMAGGDGADLEVRTDVYLLGAVLHEVLTGAPPHEASNLIAMLNKAWQSEPHDYAADVPSELAALCRHAMQRDRAQRPEGADAVRRALATWLEHRGSEQLVEQADLRLAELEARRSMEAAGGGAELTPAVERELRRLFTECRFGFNQALAAWPGNARARDGLDRVLVASIEHELAYGSGPAAAALLDELTDPAPELRARVEARRAGDSHAKKSLARLARLDHEADLTVGARLRLWLAVLSGAFWFAGVAALAVVRRMGVYDTDNTDLALLNLWYISGTVVGSVVTRKTLFVNEANRRSVFFAFLGYGLYTAYFFAAARLDVPLDHAATLFPLLAIGLWALMGTYLDRAALWMIPPLVVGWVVAVVDPSIALELIAVCGCIGLVSVGVAWSRRATAEETQR